MGVHPDRDRARPDYKNNRSRRGLSKLFFNSPLDNRLFGYRSGLRFTACSRVGLAHASP